MKTILTRELVRHILGKLGLVPPPNLGKLGITTREFLLDKRLVLEYDDGRVEFPMWCGKVDLGSYSIVALATDIAANNYHEFCAVFTVENKVVHGIKHIFSDAEDSMFVVHDPVSGWKPTGLRHKLLLTAGMEQIADTGAKWIPDKEYEELYDRLIDIVEMG